VKVWIKRLGLLHWGEALVDQLTDPDDPRIQSIADLYRLTIDDLIPCTSGQKMAQKCYEVLHAGKKIPLELLLASLNIPNFALATATDIVQAGYDTVEKCLSLTYEDLLKVPNVGEVTARQVFDGIQERRCVILELTEVLDIQKPSGGPLAGKSFCITGSTSKPRKALEKLIMEAGGVAKSSVGSGLSFLVTNSLDTTSSKMQNAKKHGVHIISENDLNQMINSIAS
jgi:NAD-dependent DNA ligase